MMKISIIPLFQSSSSESIYSITWPFFGLVCTFLEFIYVIDSFTSVSGLVLSFQFYSSDQIDMLNGKFLPS